MDRKPRKKQSASSKLSKRNKSAISVPAQTSDSDSKRAASSKVPVFQQPSNASIRPHSPQREVQASDQLSNPLFATGEVEALRRPTTLQEVATHPKVTPPAPSETHLGGQPRLRRKPSTIGRYKEQARSTETGNIPAELPVNTKRNAFSELRTSRGLAVTPHNDDAADVAESANPPYVHPALRDSGHSEGRRSLTPHSNAAANTPSTRYTASPAFSQVSSRTSVSSYSPRLPNKEFGSTGSDRTRSRRGPPLPASPKAFKDGDMQAAPRSSQDIEDRAEGSAKNALKIDTRIQSSERSRPRRPSREGTPDLSDMMSPNSVIHSDLSPTWSPASLRSRSRDQGFSSPTELSFPADDYATGGSVSQSSWDRRDSASPSQNAPDTKPLSRDFEASNTRGRSPGPPTDRPSSSHSRLGRLLRRDKGQNTNTTKSEHNLRRGPAAGTGHEGYGKFGFRGRNFSFSSLTKAGRSRSADSMASETSSRPYSRKSILSSSNDSFESDFSTVSTRYGNETLISAERKSSVVDHDALLRSGLVTDRSFEDITDLQELRRPADLQHSGRDIELSKPSRSGITSGKADKPAKPARRWNFFQRSQAKKDLGAETENEVPGKDDAMSQLGYYALSPAESQVDPPRMAYQAKGSSSAGPHLAPYQIAYDEGRHSSLLPSPPLRFVRNQSDNIVERPSRNPQVGRAMLPTRKALPLPSIETKLAASNTQTSITSTPVKALPRHPQANLPPITPRRTSETDWPLRTMAVRDSSPELTPIDTSPPEEEFLSMHPRQMSDLSFTSSSGRASFQSTSTLVANAQAVTWMGDEDVWNEYNDLIDETSPTTPSAPARKIQQSISSSLDRPFQYDEGDKSRPASKILPQVHALIQDLEAPPALTEIPKTGSPDRFSHFLQPAATPSTPYSLSDIMAGYGERTASFASTKARQSAYEVRQSMESGYSSNYSGMSGPSRPISKLEIPEKISPVLEETDPSEVSSPNSKKTKARRSADADLRFGALMTSKWLSFGRVLFSPAHNEVKTGEDVRVLVVDGLGRDWSYYCALTYPKATFYNLEINSSDVKPSNKGQDLNNYRNVRHTSLASPFPFPRGFFTAVIFRFPIAATDRAYHACIFECKRVLRPGGFLELSLLDLDMMNMGPKARRALRALKLDIHGRDSQVSLRNIGDSMLTLVGRRGFESIQRCIVGIPVAGRIPRSGDLSSDGSGRSEIQAAIDAHDRGQRVNTTDFTNVLYSQKSDSPTRARDNDEGITKMIAKVGRWWYSTCYGTTTAPAEAMWEEPGLLRECEREGTAFRLLLCYAQKPTCPPRRTASV